MYTKCEVSNSVHWRILPPSPPPPMGPNSFILAYARIGHRHHPSNGVGPSQWEFLDLPLLWKGEVCTDAEASDDTDANDDGESMYKAL